MCIRKTGESTAVRFNTVSSVLGNLQILCPVTILSSWAVLERDLGIYGAVRLSQTSATWNAHRIMKLSPSRNHRTVDFWYKLSSHRSQVANPLAMASNETGVHG